MKLYKKTISLLFCMGVKVSYIKGRKQIKGVWEQGAEENIWT
jgi:hypothetical protein